MDKELEKAHLDYIERKERILDNLICMRKNLSCNDSIFKYFPKNYLYWLEQAIEIIKEREI